jgi:hypothetical protein
MEWFWTWGGKCFGYRNGDNLWTYSGSHIGKFYGDEVYDRNGHYLGEVKSNNRLITNRSKKNFRKPAFSPYGKVVGYVKYVDYVGNVMYAGYQDFPTPDTFK